MARRCNVSKRTDIRNAVGDIADPASLLPRTSFPDFGSHATGA
jgi:hypothetical protein